MTEEEQLELYERLGIGLADPTDACIFDAATGPPGPLLHIVLVDGERVILVTLGKRAPSGSHALVRSFVGRDELVESLPVVETVGNTVLVVIE